MIEKGSSVHFVLSDGERYVLPPNAAMLHDPDSVSWPRNSVLFTTVTRDNLPVEMDADQREYFGRGYRARLGRARLPPRDLRTWEEIGLVRRIYYSRSGLRAPGLFVHTFRAPTAIHGALIGAVVGGLLGALISKATDTSTPIFVGAIAGAGAGAYGAKVSYPFDPPARLFRRNRVFRLELPRMSHLSWRGMVIP